MAGLKVNTANARAKYVRRQLSDVTHSLRDSQPRLTAGDFDDVEMRGNDEQRERYLATRERE